MGFFDWLMSPFAQLGSIVRTLIIGVIILVIFFLIWITVLAKSKEGMNGVPSGAPLSMQYGMYGVARPAPMGITA